MAKSSKTITLALIGSALLLASCETRERQPAGQGETTGTATRRHGVGFLPWLFMGSNRGISGARTSSEPGAAVSRSSRGGFGGSARGVPIS